MYFVLMTFVPPRKSGEALSGWLVNVISNLNNRIWRTYGGRFTPDERTSEGVFRGEH